MGVWDFIGKSTDEYTHNLHLYPARLNPNVARRLIKLYGDDAKNILDPYCGSGTTLVEARLAGLDAHGFDINPSARLISEAKTRDYDLKKLEKYFEQILILISETDLVSWEESVDQSGVPAEVLETWIPINSAREVATTLKIIENVQAPKEFINLARVILSDCLREISNQRAGEWKLYRKEGFLIKNLKEGADINEIKKLPLIQVMTKKINSTIHGITELSNKLNQSELTKECRVFDTNSVHQEIFPSTPGKGYDLVVTSPPYGDSATTVAYSQFSWFSNTWLGLDRRTHGKLASEMMGGNNSSSFIEGGITKFGCQAIDSAISKMEDSFARKNYFFYRDYLESIRNVAQNVKSGGFVCYVVGNRTSGGEYMRMDLFTKWAFEKYGFKSRKIKERTLPNTRMPGKIAVTEDGVKRIIPTMNKELIVVCQKN